MKILKKLLLVLFLFFTFVASQILAKAAGGSTWIELTLANETIMDNKYSYVPNMNAYPYTDSSTTTIGFDSLYGTKQIMLEYNGEIPYGIHQKGGKTEDGLDVSKLRYYKNDKIGPLNRQYSMIEEPNDFTKLNVNSEDPRIKGLTVENGIFTNIVFKFLLIFVNGIRSIIDIVIRLLIELVNFDISSAIKTVDKNNAFGNLLRDVFLYNSNDGILSLSPFMALALVGFILGLIRIAFEAFRGNVPFKSLFNEFLMFVLSFLVLAASLNMGNVNTIASAGTNIATALSNEVVMSTTEQSILFKYNTSNPHLDMIHTQQALLNKQIIDSVIQSQFGYSVNDLNLYNINGGEGDFGSVEAVNKAIQDTYGENADINYVKLSTSSDGSVYTYNLGYLLQAANTGTLYSSEGAWSVDGNVLTVSTASNDRTLFIMDLLANLKKANMEAGNTKIVNKINVIMENMYNPNYVTLMSNSFLLILQHIALGFALLLISLYTLTSKVVIAIGPYAMVIIPIMLLFKSTRNSAKNMLVTYLHAFIQFILGLSIFNIIMLIAVMFGNAGIVGIAISIILMIGIALNTPKILTLASEATGTKYVPNMLFNKVNGKVNSFANKLNPFRNLSVKLPGTPSSSTAPSSESGEENSEESNANPAATESSNSQQPAIPERLDNEEDETHTTNESNENSSNSDSNSNSNSENTSNSEDSSNQDSSSSSNSSNTQNESSSNSESAQSDNSSSSLSSQTNNLAPENNSSPSNDSWDELVNRDADKDENSGIDDVDLTENNDNHYTTSNEDASSVDNETQSSETTEETSSSTNDTVDKSDNDSNASTNEPTVVEASPEDFIENEE